MTHGILDFKTKVRCAEVGSFTGNGYLCNLVRL